MISECIVVRRKSFICFIGGILLKLIKMVFFYNCILIKYFIYPVCVLRVTTLMNANSIIDQYIIYMLTFRMHKWFTLPSPTRPNSQVEAFRSFYIWSHFKAKCNISPKGFLFSFFRHLIKKNVIETNTIFCAREPWLYIKSTVYSNYFYVQGYQGGQHPGDGRGRHQAGGLWLREHCQSRQQFRRHALLDGSGGT